MSKDLMNFDDVKLNFWMNCPLKFKAYYETGVIPQPTKHFFALSNCVHEALFDAYQSRTFDKRIIVEKATKRYIDVVGTLPPQKSISEAIGKVNLIEFANSTTVGVPFELKRKDTQGRDYVYRGVFDSIIDDGKKIIVIDYQAFHDKNFNYFLKAHTILEAAREKYPNVRDIEFAYYWLLNEKVGKEVIVDRANSPISLMDEKVSEIRDVKLYVPATGYCNQSSCHIYLTCSKKMV